ncbi:MAG TPA: 2-phospho-L-lactate guanylyltransferase [Candidatus Bathyarchaeia archaeon]|nr:2-phospho-L-lactate guanylyltransferase [Candidatus Bathyarchaeia archaeon]
MKSTINSHIHAIVPLKIPSKSKTRLSHRLTRDQRSSLTIAMLVKVLTALRGARTVSSVTVVCADRRVRSITEKCGATFLWEGHRHGLNRALNFALKNLPNDSAVLIIHADLPFLTAKEVDQIVNGAADHSIALVPSKDKTGTNAILMQVPGLIKLAFGKDSFRKHLNLTKKKRVSCSVLRIEGVAFDVDEEDDLDELLRRSGIKELRPKLQPPLSH